MLTSLLSFGAGSGGSSTGQDLDLSPGVYFLAVAAYDVGYGDEWAIAPRSSSFGVISLSLRTTRPCECTPLTITTQPQDASASLLGGAAFSVGFTGTTPEIQWQRDGRNIPGANNPALTISSAQASDAGAYRAVLTNCCSTVTSRAARLTIQCPSDFNSDGFTDFFDYLAYVECFEGALCPPGKSADFNGDGFLDFFDYADFLAEFEGNGLSFCSCPVTTAPEAFAAGNITSSSAMFSWGAAGSCDQTYEIDRSDDGGSTYRTAAVLDAGTFSWSVTDLLPTSETKWRIRACRFDGRSNACSPWSQPVVVVRTPCVPLPAPANVRVCNVWSTAVDVCWSDVAQGESGYIVEKSSDGVNFSLVTVAGANTSRQRASGLTSGQNYVFRVSTWVDSPPGFADCITIGGTASATPDCVRVPGSWRVASTTSSSVCLLWTDTSTCETRFVIQQSVWDGAAWGPPEFGENVPSNRGDACRTGLSSGTRYRFRIRAEIEGGRVSDWSEWITADTGQDCLQPPGNFRVASVAGTQVCLLWSDTSSCEDRFVIEQSRWNGSSWEAAEFGENVPPNRGDACRTGLAYDTLYRFRIRAEIAGVRTSAWSNWAEARTASDCLQPPGSFRVASVAENQVCLLWNDTSSCETRFVIEQSRWNGSSWDGWVLGENVPANRGDACRTGLAYNTLYRFRIAAEIEPVRGSPWSNVVEATTGDDCLQPPSNLRVASVSGNQVCLLWGDSSSCETRFVIEQSRWNGTSWDGWVLGENVPANRGDACRTGLAYSTLYRFRVAAEIEGVRGSPWSNVVEATTGNDCVVVPGSFRVLSTGCGSVTLAWTDTSTCETRFVIEDSLWDGSAWSAFTFGENVPANATTAVRTGLVADGLYRFRIKADIEGDRSSAWTINHPEGRATPGCLDAPTSLRRGSVTSTSVELFWNDNSSCETQFQIYQRRFTMGSWQAWELGENVPANAERAIRDGTGANPIVRGGLYQFYVIADQGSCESPRSNILEVDLPN
ncbi:MAG: hypothetical protein HEQ23_06990 [Tepidisphaera sp.]